ncbi:MAG TPA: tetratricopeptide repeat protein [Bryobacteraceae bacterium]|nr:tetratricopeptide repeat protein [Bryobacteraceae bacterium]
MFEAIRSHIPPPASEINQGVNQLVSRTVHKAMAKQPWHRFSSAKELAETLQKALHNEPIERFDRTKIQPRLERVKKAQSEGDYQFATEILTELESEGHMDPEMSALRIQLDQSIRNKTIRQLLDSARTRMEEDEYPLALQKIQDVLNLDPNNADATTLRNQIERQRGQKQIDNWFRVVAQHLDNEDYRRARQGLEEILKVNSSDPRARELLSRVERTEQELSKAREEKQKLYDAALVSYRSGEISTALSKLERLLEINRSGPKSTTPERDAQYQSLYNQIRSERDAARSTYAEGRKHLTDKNFAKALEICEDFLDKHPGDPLFQALKIEVEEAQRQEQSAAIAEISRRVESEPDLDKKYNIVQEAVEKYPAEVHFKQSLKLIKDRRDLVNSIVNRARQYEERGQLNDAAGQWDILRNIYPLYPGLDFEMQRLARRRDEQVTEEAKARWVERIDRHFGAGEYSKAREVVKQALAEFPDDQELRGLDSLGEQALRRSEQANALLQEGQKLIAANRFEDGIEVLRNAERLDERSSTARAALLGALLQRARDLMSSDWRAAEPLVKEVLELEPSDPVARSLTSLIADYRRQEAVSNYLLEARNLQAAGSLEAALAKAEQALQAFPNESRLVQLQHTLRGAVSDNRKKEPLPPTAEPVSAGAETLLMPPPPPVAHPPVKPPVKPPAVSAEPLHAPAAKAETPKPAVAKPQAKDVPAPSSAVTRAPDEQRKRLLVGVVVAAIALIAAALIVAKLKKTGTSTDTQLKPIDISVSLSSNAPGTHYLSNGKTVSSPLTLKPGTSMRVEAEADGFISDSRNIAVPSTATKPFTVTFNLQPALPEMRINSDLGGGKLVFDQAPPIILQEGSVTKDDIQPGPHQVDVLDAGNRRVFGFSFEVKPREVLTLASPPKGAVPGIVVSSLGSSAIVYGTANLKGGIEGQALKPIPPEGEKLKLSRQGSLRYIVDDGRAKPHAVGIDFSPLPAVTVTLSGAVERIPFTITSNVPDGMVVLNGRDWKPLVSGTRSGSLPPGKYRVLVRADDYEPAAEQIMELKSGDTTSVTMPFTLNRVLHMASLVVQSAPAGTEVWLDGTSLGTTDSSGVFKTEISPASHHTITLKKQNYVDQVEHHEQIAAGQTVTVIGNQLKPFGKLVARVTPANATVTYKRNGEQRETQLQNGQEVLLPPGDYVIRASAEGRLPDQQGFTIISGKEEVYAVTLPSPVVADDGISTPEKLFQNGKSWNYVDEKHWWVYDEKGFSFLKKDEGTFTFILLRDPKAFLKEKIKRYEFVGDYRDEDNKILYALDPHHLSRKVFVDGKERKEDRSETAVNVGETYRLIVQITADTINVKVNGSTDTVKRLNVHGKFGFVNGMVLTAR